MPRDKNGILGTILFHNVLLLLLIFFGFSSPKSLPGIESIKIDFGNEGAGNGMTELETEAKTALSVPEQKEDVAVDSREDIVTQDFEEAPKVITKKKEDKKEKTVEKTIKPVEKPREKPKQVVNTNALYKGKATDSESDASEGKDNIYGNRGKPEGDKDSDNDTEGLAYGSGVSFSLEGRDGLLLPKPELRYQKQGTVIVEIIVDRQGNVVSANSGVKGSTTLDPYLVNSAEKAALKSKFSAKPDARFHQKGYITYHFKLK